jgi:hypothetical protein
VLPPPPSQPPPNASQVGKGGYCKVCEKRLKKKHNSKTAQELRKMKDQNGNKLVGQTYLGCPLCNKGKGERVCPKEHSLAPGKSIKV